MKTPVVVLCIAICVLSYVGKLYISSDTWYNEALVQKKIIDAGTACSGEKGSVNSPLCRKNIEEIARSYSISDDLITEICPVLSIFSGAFAVLYGLFFQRRRRKIKG